MTEFDFDELDKAVNSLMEKTPNTNESSSISGSTSTATLARSTNTVTDELTVERKVGISSDSDLESDNTKVIELSSIDQMMKPPQASSPSESIATNPGAAKDSVAKRRGTFMDVVHPSAGVRSKLAPTVLRPVSRQGASIQSSQQPVIEPVVNQDLMALRRAPVTPRAVDDRELTDILSNSASQEATSSYAAVDKDFDDNNTSLATEVEKETPTNVPAPDTQAYESLFISDAKVDKRPLGVQLPATDDNADKDSPSTAQERPPQQTELPAELSGRIMEIESEKESTTVRATPVQAPALPSRQSAVAVSTVRKKTVAVDEDHPAIYDPAYYKQETKPNAKKKSGLWVVLAIIGLILLGGAGGVVYYFYTTGSF